MAASSGFHISSSPFLRLRSSSVAYASQPPFLSPCNGRSLAESFCLATVTVSRQNLSVSPPSAVVEARISGTIDLMTPPYNVLITGSTKGIGHALAREFLKAGDNVVICSRSGKKNQTSVFVWDSKREPASSCYVLNDCFSVSAAERVESVVESLKEEYGEHVWVRTIPFSITCFWLVMVISYEMLMMLKNYRQGTKCDVREGKDVRELVGYCQNNLKYIDIWVIYIFLLSR